MEKSEALGAMIAELQVAGVERLEHHARTAVAQVVERGRVAALDMVLDVVGDLCPERSGRTADVDVDAAPRELGLQPRRRRVHRHQRPERVEQDGVYATQCHVA